MEKLVRIAVDAMGGDYAPAEPVKGAVEALAECKDVIVVLVGKEDEIKQELAKYKYDTNRIEVVHASDVITNNDHPVDAVRRKKDASSVVASRLVKEGKADAVVSAGNTGAFLVGASLIIGKIKGVERSPLGTIIPTLNNATFLVDAGANVDARPSHLVQFAQMGSIYMENVLGIKNPKVGLLSNGVEEEKGNALTKDTFPLLKACKEINFVGNVEARDVPDGIVDVVVCEGFTGNVLLKTYEGAALTVLAKLKDVLYASLKNKICALILKPSLKIMKKDFDASEYGGAPLLGLKGLAIKSHGNSKAKDIKNCILKGVTFVQKDVTGKITERLGKQTVKKTEAKSEAKPE